MGNNFCFSDDEIFYRFLKTKNKHPRGVVLITHGFRSYGSAHQCLVKVLLKKGYHVVIWDLPGHGRSGGERGYIEDFSKCVSAQLTVLAKSLKKEHRLPYYFLAHSTGFCVTVLALSYLKEKNHFHILSNVRGALGVDPAFHLLHNVGKIIQWMLPIIPLLARSKYIGHRSVGGWDPACITDDKKILSCMQKNRYFYRGRLFFKTAWEIYFGSERAWLALQNLKIPLGFIYGEFDTVAFPLERSELQSLSSKNVTVKIYKGLKHNPLDGKRARAVLSDILFWLEEN